MKSPNLSALHRINNQIRAHQKHAIQSRWRRYYKKQIARPSHPQLLLRQAIQDCGLRYRPMVEIFNPNWKGREDWPVEEGLPQWIDAVVWLPDQKPGAIILLCAEKGRPPRKRQRRAAEALVRYLTERGVRYLIVEDYPSYQLRYMIQDWIREETE